MKLLLFGGSFDPVHRGHLALAAAAVLSLGMDRVLFLPARQNPLKTENPLASNEQRLRWLQLVTAGIPWAEVGAIELERAEPSYSWKTVQWARQTWPKAKLHWLIGTDQWQQLDSWARIEWLDEKLTWVVGARDGQSLPDGSVDTKRRSLWLTDFDHPANSTAIRESGQSTKDEPSHDWVSPMIAAELDQVYKS